MVRAAARGTTRAATARVPVTPPVPSLRAARARAGKAKTTRRLGRVAAASTSSVTVTCPVCTEAVYEWKPEGSATGSGGDDASFGAEDKEPVIACGACRKRFRSAGFLDMTILPQSALKGDSSFWGSVFDVLVPGSFPGAIPRDADSGDGDGPSRYTERLSGGTQLFRSPLVSFAYERGWRQRFDWAGFPGRDKEFQMMMDLYEAGESTERANGRGIALDVSCGTGLFSRKLLRCGRFVAVVASDFSQAMLEQTREYINSNSGSSIDGGSGSVSAASRPRDADVAPLLLVRADVGRLPFESASFDLVHAGAALHCWPNPSLAMAEISRVLKPGGVFIGSTFLLGASPLGQALGSDEPVRPFLEVRTAQCDDRTLSDGLVGLVLCSVGREGVVAADGWGEPRGRCSVLGGAGADGSVPALWPHRVHTQERQEVHHVQCQQRKSRIGMIERKESS